MDILKRSLAPIFPAAWDEIDEQATTVLKGVIEAARKAALFEDTAVFQGLEEAGILGLELEADNEPVEIKLDDESILEAVVEAMLTLGSRS